MRSQSPDVQCHAAQVVSELQPLLRTFPALRDRLTSVINAQYGTVTRRCFCIHASGLNWTVRGLPSDRGLQHATHEHT